MFLGHATAQNLLNALKECLPALCSITKIIQLSMDGPAVNWKLVRLLNDELLSESSHKLLNIGSCGVHVVHGAFKTGFQKSGWDIEIFLSAFYYTCKNSPSRCADFTVVTGSTSYPMKFFGVRWLENVPVANKMITIFPASEKYVVAVFACSKNLRMFKSCMLVSTSLSLSPVFSSPF